MITVVIPSFDRASQLDCFLRSMEKHWDLSQLSIQVLYKYSNEEFKAGYDLLRWKNRAKYIGFWQEQDFCDDFKTLVPDTGFTMLATDDCVFFRDIDLTEDDLIEYFGLGDIHCFSLRLGENTIIQDYVTYQQQDEVFKYGGQKDTSFLRWNFKRHNRHNNYGYAYSLDMSIYRSSDLLWAIKPLTFESPRALEHQLNANSLLRDGISSFMMSLPTSVGFVNTINCVQPNGPPAGTRHAYSVTELNKKFLGGRRINLSSFEHLVIISSHEEVPLTFEDF